MKPSAIEPGMKVHYIAFEGAIPEDGIVKSVCYGLTHAFVVFKCDGNWENYYNYTAQKTRIADLHIGWVNQPVEEEI